MASVKKQRSSGTDPRLFVRRLGLLVLLGAWVFGAGSLVGFDPHDPPSHLVSPVNDPVNNWCGSFGAVAAYQLISLLGHGSYVLMAFLGIGLLHAAMSPPAEKFGSYLVGVCVRTLGLFMLAGAISGLQNLLFSSSGAFPGLAGGKLGVVGVEELSRRFGNFGSGLVLLLMGVIGAVVAMDEWVMAFSGWFGRVARERGVPAAVSAGRLAGAAAGSVAISAGSATATAGRTAGRGLAGVLARWLKGRGGALVREHDLDAPARRPGTRGRPAPAAEMERAIRGAGPGLDEDESADEEEPVMEDGEGATITVDEDEDEELEADEPVRGSRGRGGSGRRAAEPRAGEAGEGEGGEAEAPGAPQVYDADALREKISKLPIVFGQANRSVATDADLAGLRSEEQEAEKPYVYPGLELLAEPEANFNTKLEEYVREQAAALEGALQQYRIDGHVVGIESGPVITLYDVRLAPGTKVAALQAVASDVARALKAVNIRIVANQIGRDTVGIEVPNREKEKVRLKELMSKTEKFEGMKLPMFLGKDASGEPLIADLTTMPHMLIAGTTGSGKSVCMNTIIMSFLYTKKPGELKMVLVDPKMVEMSQFRDIPHLMCPVVTEMGKAAAILEWACGKMDERYELLAEAGCRDIAGYNDLSWEELKERMNVKSDEEGARIPRKLPYMVFIIDELADLMMTAKEVESHIIRIAQKARAVGIHLILATQRPQANVVTGLIKSNMPCRIGFKVASGMDSRIVLDQKGGELLLGHGDMLFLSPRTTKLTRAQGTLVDDPEIRRVVRFLKEVSGPSFERQLLQIRRSENGTGLGGLTDEERALQSQNNSSASLAAAQEDPLFPRAVEIVLETRRGSVSLLQRRLAIGYTRASRLIDLMGIAGIISDHKGSVARDVLITIEDWEAMKQLAREQGASLDVNPEEQGRLFAGEARDTSAPAPGEPGGAEEAPFAADDEPADEPADESDDGVDEGESEDEDGESDGVVFVAEGEDEYEEEADEDLEEPARRED